MTPLGELLKSDEAAIKTGGIKMIPVPGA